MINKWLGTMSVRIFLITVIGILLTATTVRMLGQRDFRENEFRLRDQFAFDRVESVVRILEATLPEKRIEIQDVFKRMGNRVTLGASKPAQPQSLPPEMAHLSTLLVPEVADLISLAPMSHCEPRRLPPPEGFRNGPPPSDGFGMPPRPHGKCLAVYTHLEDQTPVLIEMHYGSHRPPNGGPNQRTPMGLLLGLIGLIAIIWTIASVATKPLRKLADAALKLADNIEQPPLPENKGSTEVRHAAKAFNEMQRSILKHIQERGFILGAIAHDLQTPLTRLRLRLEKVKDLALKESLIKDLIATQEMVSEGLDFARLCGENIHKNKVDLTALATAVCDDFDESGQIVTKSLPEQSVTIMGSAHLLTRCLTNLLNNAFVYAKNPALSMQVTNKQVMLTLSDDGPGIPETALDSVLEPFRRLEDSRSRQTGGTGLGLAIARMIVEKHGGKLTLSNKAAPATGLIVQITLPLH